MEAIGVRELRRKARWLAPVQAGEAFRSPIALGRLAPAGLRSLDTLHVAAKEVGIGIAHSGVRRI